jgi:hypothetical protein
MRKRIYSGEIKVLRWPGDSECPVQKRQRFKVQGIIIEIDTIQRKIVKGKPPEWHATFIRHERDRVYLMRQSLPVQATHERPEDVTLDMAERARRDGNYTSSPVVAIPQEPETVGPDWKDKKRLERERARQEALKQIRRKKYERDTSRRVKIAIEQKFKELNARGCDYMPLVAEIYELFERWSSTDQNAA